MFRKPGGTDMGTYRVYKTFHEFDQNGRYRCEFEALPSDLEYLPMPEVPIPAPNPIEVKVWDNEDPKGLGRVRVEFPFDERTCETWIPMMSLDAGGKGKGLGPVNRGFVFIPEKGDSVLVDFLDGQPLSHPVVIGSMYHGENAENQGGGKGNHIKTIMTRSNHRIEFNDKEADGWGITVSDRNGNTLHFDTKGKNMTMTAPETVTINAKHIIMNGSKSVSVHSPDINIGDHDGELENKTVDINGKQITIDAGKSILEQAPKIDIEGSRTVNVKTAKMGLSGSTRIDIRSPRIDSN